MSYYEERYHKVNEQLMEAYRTIGAYTFRVDHLMEALERIAKCDDLITARVIAHARVELCADWKSNLEIIK
jgi:hypothetical protein